MASITARTGIVHVQNIAPIKNLTIQLRRPVLRSLRLKPARRFCECWRWHFAYGRMPTAVEGRACNDISSSFKRSEAKTSSQAERSVRGQVLFVFDGVCLEKMPATRTRRRDLRIESIAGVSAINYTGRLCFCGRQMHQCFSTSVSDDTDTGLAGYGEVLPCGPLTYGGCFRGNSLLLSHVVAR